MFLPRVFCPSLRHLCDEEPDMKKTRQQIQRLLPAALAALWLGACTTGQPVDGGALISAPETPPAPKYGVSDVLGARAAAIDALLGSPALTRREGAGEFRRYALSGCSLIVILYPDENGEMRARYADAVALRSGEVKPDLEACLAAG